MPSEKTLEFTRFDCPVLIRGRAQDPEFDAYGVHSPWRYNRVGVPCLVLRVRNAFVATDVLGSVYQVLCLVSQVRNVDMATNMLDLGIMVQGSLQVIVEKKVEQCKRSMELSNLQARRVKKTEDSHSVTAILISMKPYPKDCWGGSWSHRSHVLPLQYTVDFRNRVLFL